MSQALCIKHNSIIQYICTLQKCPQGHLICELCKQMETEHFAQHLNFIYVFKQFINFQNAKSYKDLLPKLEKAIIDCQTEINNQKNLFNSQINQINNDFKKLHDIIMDIQQKTQKTIVESFSSDSKKHEEKLQNLKAQLREFSNQKQKQTSFFGSLFNNQQIKANNTLQLIDKILNKNRSMFKIRADLLYFDKQIKKSNFRMPKYKKTQKSKQKFNQMLKNSQNLVKKIYSDFNQLFGEDELRKSIVGEMRRNSIAPNSQNSLDNRSLYASKVTTSSQKSLKSASQEKNEMPPNLPKTTYPTLHPTIASILQSLDPMPVNSLSLKQQGPYKYKEGIYIGNYNNKMRHGKGKFIFNDGSYYEGYWRNDVMFGVGRLISKSFYYQGEINQGKAQGNGRMQDTEKIYNGQWYNDMKHGQGRLQYKNGKLKYSGSFQNNLFHGNGILECEQWRYQGSFINGQKSGDGIIRYTNGESFNGKFKNDLKIYGRFVWPDSSFYEGSFQKDIPHGTGIFYWSDGTRYQGGWKKGEQHGIGKQIYADGKQRRGQWENGQWKRWY